MKRILSIIAAVLFVASVFAQVPERISYQAVVRNTKGLLIINTQIGMEINIRRSTPTGTIVYTETQTPTTNANGLVSIEIGTGSEFSAIRWGNDTYFIETKTAVEPPLTDYTITGISKLLSVPYALHAKTADSITGPITEADPLYTASQASNITAADLVKLSNLSGVNTGDQDLSSLATTASVTTGLATKVDKVEGKGLSTNDYTTTEQSKLAGIATGAEVNVNADWNATSGDAQILNKPEIANADWNATTGMAQILNKPTIANADWNATTGMAQILNKPTIPTAADLVKLSNLSGVNTGDQDLSSLATTASVTTGLATKVDKVEGKGLSTNDYTTTEQSKLAGIATGAEVNVNADWNATSGDAQILNKPEIANADWNATTGMAQILNKPTIPTAADLVKLSNLSGVNTGDQDLSSLATTASVTTGLATKVDKVEGKGLSTNDYTTTEQSKLAGIATGAEVNVNADWNATSGDAQILNKPEIANADWNATTGMAQILNKPTIANADWNASSGAAQILNKPTIPTAADLVKLSNLSGVNTGDQDLSSLATTSSVTTGLATKVDKVEGKGLSTNDYTTTEQSKLAGIATGAEVNVNADWNATSGDAQILNKPEIANADWNATTGMAQILNKPTIANADWNASSGAAQILNKPTIPTAADLVKLSNLSGVNTGDQDLSSLATTASVTTGLATKVDKVEGKGLSTNDYTTTEQSKLAGIATGAEVNVNADWNATSGDAQILNKPTIPTAADGSETKVTAGTSITVSGTGTTANPYVINGPVSTTLTIGQSYQGGVIFWLDATGQHGLIAATVDQGHLIKWSKNNDRIVGATGNGMYAGAMNTAIIVAALMPEQQTETFAAQLCADYSVTVDGVMYGDWYLPSIYELKLLQQKKDIVGNFIAESYWSSTEYTQTGHPDYPKIMATSLSFSGFQYEPTGDYKYSTSFKNVRAIRAF